VPVNSFPRSGAAKTTGSALRVRREPSLSAPVLGQLSEQDTAIQVVTQTRGDAVDGNDVWNQIDYHGRPAFVSGRYVQLDGDSVK
jgi:hypothetical protein